MGRAPTTGRGPPLHLLPHKVIRVLGPPCQRAQPALQLRRTLLRHLPHAPAHRQRIREIGRARVVSVGQSAAAAAALAPLAG